MNLLDLGNRAVRRVLMTTGVRSQTARVLGHEVHYYQKEGTGSGPPLLLVHGLGSSANSFFRTLGPLAKTFRSVWALDFPGNGFSPIPDAGPVPVRQQVEVLLEFRRSVIREQVFLVGNSLGGGLSLYAANAEPGVFKALALVSPAGAKLHEERLKGLIKSFDVQTTSDARLLANKLFAKPSLPVLLFAGELRKMMASPTVRQVMREVSPADAVTEEMLSSLPMPTMLIWGQQEKLLPYEAIEYFRAHLPKSAEIHEVRQFGHMPQVEHPADFVEHLTGFAQRRGLLG